MFNRPLEQIQYSDIEKFCQTFAEGVRVEYKRQMIDNLPKTVSAFANTLGGIIVIGVETEKINNKVIAIPGIDKMGGIEERIINSSLNGIYPGIMPEVKTFDVPNQKDKIIIVIKVHESLEAPHAIQNSTRVYIRTGSISQPYELSEIDRIEYLLQRRNKQQQFREQIKQDARFRIERLLKPDTTIEPFLEVSISPYFPYQPLATLEDLYTLIGNISHNLPFSLRDSERTINGLCKFYGKWASFSYTEINHYGLIFNRQTLDKVKSKWQSIGIKEEDKKVFIYFGHIVLYIARILRFASSFYERVKYGGNLEIEVQLQNIAGQSLMYVDNGYGEDYKALDGKTCSKKVVLVDSLESDFTKVIISLSKNILWIFNMPPTINPEARITEVLKENRLS